MPLSIRGGTANLAACGHRVLAFGRCEVELQTNGFRWHDVISHDHVAEHCTFLCF